MVSTAGSAGAYSRFLLRDSRSRRDKLVVEQCTMPGVCLYVLCCMYLVFLCFDAAWPCLYTPLHLAFARAGGFASLSKREQLSKRIGLAPYGERKKQAEGPL